MLSCGAITHKNHKGPANKWTQELADYVEQEIQSRTIADVAQEFGVTEKALSKMLAKFRAPTWHTPLRAITPPHVAWNFAPHNINVRD